MHTLQFFIFLSFFAHSSQYALTELEMRMGGNVISRSKFGLMLSLFFLFLFLGNLVFQGGPSAPSGHITCWLCQCQYVDLATFII